MPLTTTTNTVDFKLRSKHLPDGSDVPCVRIKPPQTRVLQHQTPDIILHGDPVNSGPIQVMVDSTGGVQLFDPPPPATIVLNPGASVTLHLKANLGLATRSQHFDDLDPQFARHVTFTTIPAQRCDDADTLDVIVEQ